VLPPNPTAENKLESGVAVSIKRRLRWPHPGNPVVPRQKRAVSPVKSAATTFNFGFFSKNRHEMPKLAKYRQK
jgi:hypothetical protein